MTYDHWKATEKLPYEEKPEPLAFTEADIAEAVEAMRAKCEQIARKHEREIGSHLGSCAALHIADAIAALKAKP